MVSQDDQLSVAAEHYRNLAFRVEEEARNKPLQGFVLAVSSPEPSTGKTLVSLNLALTLARGEGKVLLIEGDLRRPTLESYLQTFLVVGRSQDRPVLKSDPSEYGLWHVVNRHVTLEEATLPVWGTQLEVLPAGIAGHVDNVMAQQRMAQILTLARSRHKIVIIDSPPLILAAGRSAVARADRSLLVLRAGRTKRKEISGALSLVEEQKLLGLVLNGAKVSPEEPYAHYHHPTAGPPGPEESDDPLNWKPRVLTRSFTVTIGIALLATLVLFGSFGRSRQATPDTPEAAPQEVSIDRGSPAAQVEADPAIPTIESADLFESTTQVRLNLRAAPSYEARRLLTLDVGVKLLTLEVRGEWIRVRANGADGWVHSSGLLEIPERRIPRLPTVTQKRPKAPNQRQ